MQALFLHRVCVGRTLTRSESIDAILDKHLEQDPNARVACETLVKQVCSLAYGEIKSAAQNINYQNIVREVLNEIGYDHSDKGFDGNTCGIMVALEGQQDIRRGVDKSSGDVSDQVLVTKNDVGYACDGGSYADVRIIPRLTVGKIR